MPLYVADYMADAGHLSTTEHGAYLLLIMSYWQRGAAFRAPDEQALNVRLANVVRMSNGEWLRAVPVLSEFFQVSIEDGVTWSHKRIESELAKFRAKSLQAKEAGLASAQRRLNGRSTGVQHPSNHTDTDTDTDTKETPIPLSAPKAGAVDIWFETDFWPKWLRRPDDDLPGPALKAARSVAKTVAIRKQIMAAVEACRADRQEKEPGYRVSARRWLREGMWEASAVESAKPQELWPGQLGGRPHPDAIIRNFKKGDFIR
jgi:uncharacterized protein YdaU (DUF1376 family)